MFSWSCMSTLPLILCVNCLSRRLFLLLLWSCVQCSSGPVCRLLLWSGISKGSLVLRTCCCSDPVSIVTLVLCFRCSDGSVWSLIGPLVLYGQRSLGLVCANVSWSYEPVFPLILCPLFFVSVCPLFVWSCVPKGSLVLRTICSSDPVYPLFLFPKRQLFLSVQCSPAPVCPLFLRVCVPKGPLVHCAQSPMVLKTCCFSDAVCPLLLNPTVTLVPTDPLDPLPIFSEVPTDPLVFLPGLCDRCLSGSGCPLWFFWSCATSLLLIMRAYYRLSEPGPWKTTRFPHPFSVNQHLLVCNLDFSLFHWSSRYSLKS